MGIQNGLNYETIIDRNMGLIYKLANKYRGMRNYDLEDITQECLMKVYDEIDKYNSEYEFTTFLYAILDNHLKNLCRTQTTKSRSNHSTDRSGNDIILRDVKNYDFTKLLTNQSYQSNELDVLAIAYEVLDKNKNKELIERILNGETQTSIAKEFKFSRQYVNKIWIEFINKVRSKVK